MARNEKDDGRTGKFYCYRYAIISNGQMRLWDDSGGKRKVIEELIDYCSSTGPFKSSYYNVDNALVYIRRIGETAHLFKFCKHRNVRTFEIESDGSDVLPHIGDSFPYAYLLIDTSVQVVLIERRSGIFDNPGGAKGAFVTLVKDFMSDDNYYFSLDEILADSSFWDTIKAADAVYDVTFKLKSPNFLGAGYSTTELLKKIKCVSNNDSVTFKLESESGDLRVPKEEYGDAVEYVSAGGGSWTVSVSSGDDKRICHDSGEYVRELELTVSDNPQTNEDCITLRIRDIGRRRELTDGD